MEERRSSPPLSACPATHSPLVRGPESFTAVRNRRSARLGRRCWPVANDRGRPRLAHKWHTEILVPLAEPSSSLPSGRWGVAAVRPQSATYATGSRSRPTPLRRVEPTAVRVPTRCPAGRRVGVRVPPRTPRSGSSPTSTGRKRPQPDATVPGHGCQPPAGSDGPPRRAQPDHPDVDLDVIQPTCWITPRGALRTGPRHGLPGRGLRPTDEFRGPARSIRSYQSPHRPGDPP
jgi:hypothetical protein